MCGGTCGRGRRTARGRRADVVPRWGTRKKSKSRAGTTRRGSVQAQTPVPHALADIGAVGAPAASERLCTFFRQGAWQVATAGRSPANPRASGEGPSSRQGGKNLLQGGELDGLRHVLVE